MNRKVLVITNLFHSSPRIPGLCKYLPEFGWEPVVLTMPIGENPEANFGPPNDFKQKTKTIETPYFDIVALAKRIFGLKPNLSSRDQIKKKFGKKSGEKSLMERLVILGAAILAYPDECWGWKRYAVKKGLEITNEEKYDAILSSSSPVISHVISKKIKEKRKIPWVADLRDLWTQNHNYQYPKIRKFFETRLEKNTLRAADAFTTISMPLVEHLKSRYTDKKIFSIPNGFDPEIINKGEPTTKKFTITYTGTIYTKKQDPMKFFTAIKDLLDSKKIDLDKIEVRFYGVPQNWLELEIEKYGLENIVKQYGVVSRSESFKKQRESQILLVFGWEEKETGVFPTKLFEYMAARRPVLATGGTEAENFRKMIDETKIGKHPIDVEDIKTELLIYYQNYLKNKEVSYSANLEEIEKYSYRSMAKKFSEVLNIVSKNEKQ